MPLSDYAHHNEDAQRVWWEEEGKHAESDAENDRFDRDDQSWRDEPPEPLEGTELPTQEEAALFIYGKLGPVNTSSIISPLRGSSNKWQIEVVDEFNGGYALLTIDVTVEGWAEH